MAPPPEGDSDVYQQLTTDLQQHYRHACTQLENVVNADIMS